MAKYFFCGIGGIGMNPLAFLLKDKGHIVVGSDRGYNGKANGVFYDILAAGIDLYPQDGSGIDNSIDYFVVSTAVEKTVPDYKKALDLGIKVIERPNLLADIINNAKSSIAVGGTSGKTTTTGIVGYLLKSLKKDPLIINGGVMLNYDKSYVFGENTAVAEADESNGTIELYNPTYSIITNITLDHKSLDELYILFSDFASKTKEKVVVNADNELCYKLAKNSGKDKIFTFGINNEKADFNAYNIKLSATSSSFSLNNVEFTIQMAGIHNIQNALAAIAILYLQGIKLEDMAKTLSSFMGIKRRMEHIGEVRGINIIDDFAHNPDKITSAIRAVKPYVKGKLITIFQPHGFSPTKMMKEGYIAAFSSNLDKKDVVIMPEIYYAGGQVTRDISSNDLIIAIKNNGIKAEFFSSRKEIPDFIKEIANPLDTILIMGARDMTLNDFAKELFKEI